MKNKRLQTCFISGFLFLALGFNCFARPPLDSGILQSIQQEKLTITGKITDREGEVLIGVSVTIQGDRSQGAITDFDGNYSINVPDSKATLVFSYIGYETKSILVSGKTKINVTLNEDVQMLGEVVITGYGTLKKSSVTSAQVTVGSKEMDRTLNTTLDQALQGRVAGITATSNSGQPGGGISINIRGVNSINGAGQPLYVIDGIQIDGNSSLGDGINPMAGINPTDIASMEILQGPSATALYGSRATNGVVLITTKRGKAGQIKIDYDYTYSLQDIPKFLETMNLREYATMMNLYRKELNMTPHPEYANPAALGEGTNWQDELFSRAPLNKHQLSLSGGNDKTTYYFSTEYFDQEGIAAGASFDRISARLNLDNQAKDWLKLSTSMNISRTNDNITFSNDDLITLAIEQSPAVPSKNPDGTWGGPSESTFTLENPVALASLIDNKLKRTNFLGAFSAEVNIPQVKGLSFRTNVNVNLGFSNNYYFKPTYQMGSIVNTLNTSRRATSESTSWLWNQLVQYDNTFGKHYINAMFSHESQEYEWENLSGERSNFLNNTITELGAGDIKTANNGSGRGDGALESYLARVNYSYKDKYIAQAAIRWDGSPNFSKDNRWGSFPSLSLAWRIGEENFMKTLKEKAGMNEFKLRFETGYTGNQGAGLAYLSTLASQNTPWGTGFRPANYANDDFKWEETLAYNAGLNVSLFNSRLQFEFDYYFKKTDNMITNVKLPDMMGTTGTGSIAPPKVNIGSMENRGWAFTISTVNIDSKDFRWSSNFNISGFKNKLTKLNSESAHVDRSTWYALAGDSQFTARSTIGQPLWQFWGYIADGIYSNTAEVERDMERAGNPGLNSLNPNGGHNTALPTNNVADPNSSWVGDIKFRDLNNDGKIDDQDQTFIGNPWPTVMGGFTNEFRYKDFELSVLLTYSFGNDIFNYVAFRNSQPGRTGIGRGLLKEASNWAKVNPVYGKDESGNSTDEIVDYVLGNPGTHVSRLVVNDTHGNVARFNQWHVEDGSYIRVKNIQLNYNLSKKLLGKQNFLEAVRIGIGVQNLLTFTKYKGYDPDIGGLTAKGGDLNNSPIGLDYGRYPLTRMYTLNVSVKF